MYICMRKDERLKWAGGCEEGKDAGQSSAGQVGVSIRSKASKIPGRKKQLKIKSSPLLVGTLSLLVAKLCCPLSSNLSVSEGSSV